MFSRVQTVTNIPGRNILLSQRYSKLWLNAYLPTSLRAKDSKSPSIHEDECSHTHGNTLHDAEENDCSSLVLNSPQSCGKNIHENSTEFSTNTHSFQISNIPTYSACSERIQDLQDNSNTSSEIQKGRNHMAMLLPCID